MSDALRIDVWSDIACPWCYIGKRRLEAAIAAFGERHAEPAVKADFRSFELAPDTPVDFEGTQLELLVSRKGISEAQARAMLAQVSAIAAEVGLRYDFDALKPTRTLAAHQLLHHAKAHGLQHEAKERLMRAYFVEGRRIGHPEDLAELAAEIGLDRDDTLHALRAGEYLDAVEADQAQAARHGITAVPFFVIDGRYGVAGAQAPEVLVGALERALADRAGAAAA